MADEFRSYADKALPTLGRGIVSFRPDGEVGYIDLGNAPTFNISQEVETLEHWTSRRATRVRNRNIVTSQKANFSITLDDLFMDSWYSLRGL